MMMIRVAALHSQKFLVAMRSLLGPSLLLLDPIAVKMMMVIRNHVDVPSPRLEVLPLDHLLIRLDLHLVVDADVVPHLKPDHPKDVALRRRKL